MRAVIDTNIFIRALINPRGIVWSLLERWRAGQFTLVYSAAILDEIITVLRRPRMGARYNIDEDAIEGLRRRIVGDGAVVVPSRMIRACRDPRDDMFLEAAVAGQADVIISGDQDLLVLDPFEGIRIVGAAAFLVLLDAARAGT